jgi:hypothetical protein
MLLWIFLHNLIDMRFLRYCELNCTSKGFSCNFLHLAVKQSPQVISCDIFDKCSQPEYAGIDMIRMGLCLMFIPIFLLLLSWALSIVNFTGV